MKGSRMRWLALATLAVLLLAGSAAWVARKALAERLLRAMFLASGVRDVHFDDLQVGFSNASLRGLALGEPPDLYLAELDLRYDLLQLLRGELARVEFTGLRLRGYAQDGGFSLGTLDSLWKAPVTRASEKRAVWLLRPRAFSLRDSELEIVTAIGQLRLSLGGDAALADGDAYAGVLQFLLEHPRGSSAGELRLTPQSKDSFSADLTLRGTEPPVELTAHLQNDRSAASQSLKADFSFELRNLHNLLVRDLQDPNPPERLDLENLRLTGQVSGEDSHLQGTARLALAGHFATHKLQIREVALDLELALRWANDQLSLKLENCGRLYTEKIAFDEHLALEEPLQFCIDPEAGPLLVWDRSGATPMPLEARLALASTAFTLRYEGETDPLRVAGTTPRVSLHVEHRADANRSALLVTGGELHLPEREIALADFRFEAELGDLSKEQPFTIQSIRDAAETARFRPLRLEGHWHKQGKTWHWQSELAMQETPLRVRSNGHWNTAERTGRATLDVERLRLGAGGSALEAVFPRLGEQIDGAAGEIEIKTQWAWNAEGLTSSGDLLLAEFSLDHPSFSLENLSTILHFDSLSPLSTPAEQWIAMAELRAGLPLYDGLIEFQLQPDEIIDIARAEWELAGGHLFAQGPIDLQQPEFNVDLVVQEIQFEPLLDLLEVDGLSGNGTLSGVIPLVISRTDGVWIEGAELVSQAPGGVIRYRPSGAAAKPEITEGSIELAQAALRNFEYHTLRMTLDGEAAGALTVGLHLTGSNPEVYEGYPIELTVNVEGAFAQLLQRGLAGYRTPDAVAQRLQHFQRRRKDTTSGGTEKTP